MSHFACWTGGVLCGIAVAFVALWAAETDCCPHESGDED